MDDGRQYYGVYIETDGAPMEIETMPGLENGPRRPLLVYRLVSDFLLVHLFTGPKPKDVLEQLTAYTGRQGDISRAGFAMSSNQISYQSCCCCFYQVRSRQFWHDSPICPALISLNTKDFQGCVMRPKKFRQPRKSLLNTAKYSTNIFLLEGHLKLLPSLP